MLDLDASTIAQACEGKRASTVYASDDLAFPGIGLKDIRAYCARCECDTVPIAVATDIAESISSRVEQ